MLGLVETRQVLLIEPFCDLLAGGGDGRRHRVTVPLVPDGRGFALNADALRRGSPTRALIINSPQSDRCGAELTELAAIAEIAVAAER